MATSTNNKALAKKIARWVDERNYFDWHAYGITRAHDEHYFWNRVNAIEVALETKQGRKDVIGGIHDARCMAWIPRFEAQQLITAVKALDSSN